EAAVVRRAFALELQPAQQVYVEGRIRRLRGHRVLPHRVTRGATRVGRRGWRGRRQLCRCQSSRKPERQGPETRRGAPKGSPLPGLQTEPTLHQKKTRGYEGDPCTEPPGTKPGGAKPGVEVLRVRLDRRNRQVHIFHGSSSLARVPGALSEHREASASGPQRAQKFEREDNPPLRAARARGTAGFFTHGAHVAAPAELHREADRPAGRERA